MRCPRGVRRFRALKSAAPLKPVTRCRTTPRQSAGFRALKSAAPLKLPGAPRPIRVTPRFPRPQKRGPVEAGCSRRCWIGPTRFRALKSAAPLKPTPAPRRCAVSGPFPRPQKRGPVEASRTRGKGWSAWTFPRPQKRGPVEARRRQSELADLLGSFRALKSAAPLKLDMAGCLRWSAPGFRALKSAAPLKHGRTACDVAARNTFPRPQKRGPVEAFFRPCCSNRASSGFRALKSAAPLKPVVHVAFLCLVDRFPRPQKRGPVEASRCGRRREPTRGFRALKSAAPLKPPSVGCEVFVLMLVSAPSKARPR